MTSSDALEQLVEAVGEVLLLSSPDFSEVFYVSPAWEEVWGRPRAELLADSDTLLQSAHPHDREHLCSNLWRLADGSWDEEYRIRHPTGLRWIHHRAYPVRSDDGAVVRVAHIARDVTARKELEGSLRQSWEELQGMVERMPIGVVVHQGAQLAYANEAAAGFLGYGEADRLVGQNLLDLLHPDDVAESRERLARLLVTNEPGPPRELRARHRDGSWVTLHIHPVRSFPFGGRPANLLVVSDVTAQRRIAGALQRSEERYRAIFESSAMGIAVLDAAGAILEANPPLQELLGWDPAQFRAGEVAVGDLLEPAEARRLESILEQLRDATIAGWVRETRFRTGEVDVPVRVHVSAARGGEGPAFAVLLVEDVSERKRLELQLRQAQRIESVGRLAGGIAHDFNNLVTVIRGHTDLVLDSLAPDDPLRRDLADIRAAGERAAALTGQLLAFSRRNVLQPRVIDLNQVVEGMRGILERTIGEDVALHLERAEPLGAVRADPAQMEQVLLNLVVNARDAMPRGGSLTVRTFDAQLDEAFVQANLGATPGPHVAIEVTDSGHGMDAETMAMIFEPFFTTKPPGKGSGLGLAMTYGIVKQSGGYIRVDSAPGEGATFTIYLPRVREGVPTPSPEPELERAGERGHETVLVVEDEAAVRTLTTRLLEGRGYRVLAAADGRQALVDARAWDGPIHLVVTDVVMPGMAGSEVAERIRLDRPGTRVLYMSGYADDAIVRHGVSMNDVPFLAKPFTPDELFDMVRRVLDGDG